ncbi:MAG: dihydrodipicolinate synthase family protein [Trueperaceae bacterium]|nr:dihydrodipicolinate synthase family protein [Trueperaceae bacterium]
MPTPFKDDGSLDLASLEHLTQFLENLGVDGLVVLGVMGEAPKLSQREQDEVIRTTVAASKNIPVYAGSGAEGTDLAVEKSLNALSLGAAGLLVAPPPVQSDSVIFDYYKKINDAVNQTIILHDYPAATGIKMSPPLVAKLYNELEHVEVIKLEETPSIPKITAIRNLGCDISIVGGLGGMFFLEELNRGSDGMMTGFSYPEILVTIYKAFVAGNKEEAARVFYDACPLLRYEFQPGIGLALRKEIYRQRGAIDSAFVRHPGTQIDDLLKRELNDILNYVQPERMTA